MKRLNICGCLLNASSENLPQYLNDARIDLLEWRLDSFIQYQGNRQTRQLLTALLAPGRLPVVATNRPQKEGGLFTGPEEERLDFLKKAAELGADWIDVEDDVPEDQLGWFKTAPARLVLSHHDFTGTPDHGTLHGIVESMAKKGAQTVKIATLARDPHDNLRVLDLIAFGRQELAIDVIAFCMGPLGRWSRLACLLLGSPWSYAQLPGQGSAAPGQPTVAELRAALELLS